MVTPDKVSNFLVSNFSELMSAKRMEFFLIKEIANGYLKNQFEHQPVIA